MSRTAPHPYNAIVIRIPIDLTTSHHASLHRRTECDAPFREIVFGNNACLGSVKVV